MDHQAKCPCQLGAEFVWNCARSVVLQTPSVTAAVGQSTSCCGLMPGANAVGQALGTAKTWTAVVAVKLTRLRTDARRHGLRPLGQAVLATQREVRGAGLHGALFEARGANSGPQNHALADWRVGQFPVHLDNAALVTPSGVPINDVGRGALRGHGVTAVRTECVSSLIGAGSQRFELLGGATLATQRGPWQTDLHAALVDSIRVSASGFGPAPVRIGACSSPFHQLAKLSP